MAAKTAPHNLTNDSTIQEYQTLWQQGYDALSQLRSTWDDKEALLISKNPDKLSKTTKSQVNDGRLSTILFERAARVMAQLPSGSYHALAESNRGMASLMELVMERYVLPHATIPQDHLTKFRMLDLYSMVYGSMPILYDWQVTDSYVGPNSWIIPLRNIVFEPGKYTIGDSNWVAVSTLVSVKWLKRQRTGENAWDRLAIQYVMGEAAKHGKDPTNLKVGQRSFVERNYTPTGTSATGDNALVEIITVYESGSDGHWKTFCPDFDWVMLRDIPNPHKNGRIPILLKHCFPLVDQMIGLGDMERGMTLQKAMNALINLYLDAVKFSIFPPVKVDESKIADKSSILWEPGQKWKVNDPNAVDLLQVSPGGMQTFQSTYGFMIAALLNQNGTTDTAQSTNADPGLGKTPQALQMQAMRESSRDNWDRFMMEQTLEELYNRYIELICHKQEKPIKLYLFKDEIVRLRKEYPEDEYLAQFGRDLYKDFPLNQDGQGGTVTLKKDMIKGKNDDCEFRFYIDASSTQKREMDEENQAINNILMIVLKAGGPQVFTQMFPKIDVQYLMERAILTSGIQDAEKAIKDDSQAQQDQAKAAQAQMAQAQGQAPSGPQQTPDGLPSFPGINAPNQSPSPAPDMASMGMTAQDPAVQQTIQRINGGMS